MKNVKISVLMPVYNAEKYLNESIESILKQTFRGFEFIIIDDGSTDDSWEVIRKFAATDKRVISIRNNNNLKTSVTLNRGLRIAKGKYVVRMDADDWSYPDRLQKQYDYMEEHPNVGVSGGTIEVCDKNLRVINEREYPLTDEGVRRIIFCFSPFAHPATIWNAKIMKKVGGYNANIPLSQDCELYFKVGQSAKFGNIKEVLIKLRTHSTSSSVSKNLLQEKYAIYARIKAIIEYGYHPRFIDRLYILGRIAAMVFIPTKLKFWLFNLVRGEK